MQRPPLPRAGDDAFSKMEKASGDLFALSYGAFVVSLLQEMDDPAEVNKELDKIGFNMGCKMVEEFFARTHQPRCRDFRETVEVLGRVGFRMFVGVSAEVRSTGSDPQSVTLVITDNPLTEFVDLPPHLQGTLWYSNILCGIIRGALEQLQMRVTCRFISDVLREDPTTSLEVVLDEILLDQLSDDD
mmetsp:Transcript_63374/g.169777  ORF Transcript_63374/g.169777 Transcript_63374/m.169777 type:complete len:187 (-) Transcript_63374:92-652(-)